MKHRSNQITLESKAKALAIARASIEKKAHDVLILSVAKLTSVADYLILCSGESERQVRAIADYIDSVLASQRVSPLSIEGASIANWILMDFGDVVVHVFRSDIRHHYGLEKLWGDAKRVRLPAQQSASAIAPLRSTKTRSARARGGR